MGASASGKSSLVNAGLLPALLGGFSPRVGSHWRIAAFRPGANPIHNLARALAAPEVLATDDTDPVNAAAQVEATLRRSGFGLADAVRQGGALDGGRVLVVVDQFEELFRFHANGAEQTIGADASPFAQLLIEATQDDEAPVDVVVTMRSDFLGDCSQLRELPEAINQGLYLVPRLTRTQLHEAITAPAAVGGATLSPRLVQRLLNDAGTDPDMLPVVQHALMRTWDTWARETGGEGPIDLEHYESCGGVDDALSRHADEAYFELQGDRRRADRRADVQAHHRAGRRPPRGASPDAAGGDRRRGQSFAGGGRGVHRPLRRAGAVVRHRVDGRRGGHLAREPHPPVAEVEGDGSARRPTRATSTGAWPTPPTGGNGVRRRSCGTPSSRSPRGGGRTPGRTRRGPTATTPPSNPRRATSSGARRRRGDVGSAPSRGGVGARRCSRSSPCCSRCGQPTRRPRRTQQRRTAVARQLAASSAEAGAASRSVSILSAIEAVRTHGAGRTAPPGRREGAAPGDAGSDRA